MMTDNLQGIPRGTKEIQGCNQGEHSQEEGQQGGTNPGYSGKVQGKVIR